MQPAQSPAVVGAGTRFAASGEAIVQAVGFAPEVSSETVGWNSLAFYAWRGVCHEARFEPFAEPVIVYHVGGARSVRVRVGRSWKSSTHPGLVTIIPPATPVSWDIRGEVHSRTVHLGSRFFSGATGVADSPAAPPLSFQSGVQDPLIVAAIHALESEILHPAECGSLYADAVSDTLALHLLRGVTAPATGIASPQAGLSRESLQRSKERLEASIECGVSLQALADEVGLSRAYFAEAFRRSTGLSPHRYLTQRRLDRARMLLQYTMQPVAEIALGCGFSSQAHFSEYFRRDCGVTPRQFRLQVAG